MSTKTDKTAATFTSTYSYEGSGIGPTLREQLESSASRIIDLGRRSTEQTFELGDHLAQAAELLADGRFDKWVKNRCGLAARSARNYMSVFRNLTPYRDDLVDHSVGATVLFHLSPATADQIKTAISFAEANGRLQVSDVKAILSGGGEGGDKPEKGDHYCVGGVTGLSALIAIKTRDGLKAFIAHVEVILKAIKAALELKRVIKEALAREIEDLARVARLELESLAQFVEPDSDLRRHPRATQFPKKSGWAVVNETLQKVGLLDAWPKSKEIPGWLSNEVVPILEWAISKDRKPKWPPAEQAAPVLEQSTPQKAAPVEAASVVDRQDAASVEERLKSIAAAFGAEATVELPAASSPILPEDSLPSEALAEPPKAFKRPAFLGPKAAVSKPNDGTASAA